MRKIVRRVVLGMFVALVAVQFVPITRSNPPVETEVPAPPEVRAILQRACYDCHSNQTVWPWYASLAPASWLVARDVRNGREELNFSTWNRITAQQQVKKLKETWTEVADGEMPPWFYLAVHRDGVLSAEDRTVLREWVLSAFLDPETKEK